jgi:RimJ/RimL family protein N-acetyltransferase
LLLRQFRQTDLDAYAALLAEPEVERRFAPMPRNDAWRHMAMHVGHWKLLGYGRFAVELKATGAFIGRVGLWFPEGWPEIECGWVIHPGHWGHGYATEAAAETLRLGFATLGLAHIISLIRPDNPLSIRVAEKLGGSLEGTWTDYEGREALVYGYTSPPALK